MASFVGKHKSDAAPVRPLARDRVCLKARGVWRTIRANDDAEWRAWKGCPVVWSRHESVKRVEVNVRIGVGEVNIVTEQCGTPIERTSIDSKHILLQMTMKPISNDGEACYSSVWGPDRFERLGTLFVVPPHSLLHLRGPSRMHRSVVCRLEPALTEQWLGADFVWTARRLQAGLNIGSAEIRNLIQRISVEMRDPGFASDIKIELMVGMACIQTARYLRAVETDWPTGGLPAWRLRLIEDFVDEEPGNASLTALADLCGLSTRHLARAFRVSTGRSLGEFIAERQICAARAMLSSGASVKQTAAAVGFTTPANFAAAFRKASGCTPRQFRAWHAGSATPRRL